jgi:hypothetical protein
MEAERVRLDEHLKKLENTKMDYLNMRNNLMGDRDSLSVYARQLGYGREGEEYLRIMGLGIAINTDMPADEVYYTVNPVFISDTTIKIISMLFAFAVLVFLIIRDFLLKSLFAGHS